MKLDALIALAHSTIGADSEDVIFWARRADTLARAISDLLAEGDECGWERPWLMARGARAEDGTAITVPSSWTGAYVTADDARAMARALLRAADICEEETR